MEQLFEGNLIFLYFLGIIVIVNYEEFSKKQKIMLIYVCTYGLMLYKGMSNLYTFFLLVGGLFVYEEFLNKDSSKFKYVNNLPKRIIDFIFLYFFFYKIGYVFLAVVIFDKKFIFSHMLLKQNLIDENVIRLIISALLIVVSCEQIYNNPLEILDYRNIEFVFKKYPYYAFVRAYNDKPSVFLDKLQIVAQIEDNTYMKRQNGYSVLSMNYILTWIKEKHISRHVRHTKKRRCKVYSLKHYISKAISIIKRLLFREHCLSKTMSELKHWIREKYVLIRNYLHRKKRRYLRGYSTIEMQLIRTLAIKKGLVTGKPKSLREVYCVIVRKTFELLYTDMFFSGLKRDVNANNIIKYRCYLVYIYLHSVSTKINGKRFNSVDQMFSNDEILNWPNELIFIAALGLTYQRITTQRVERYAHVIERYGLDRNVLLDIVSNLE